jgi:hypothetical protein
MEEHILVFDFQKYMLAVGKRGMKDTPSLLIYPLLPFSRLTEKIKSI